MRSFSLSGRFTFRSLLIAAVIFCVGGIDLSSADERPPPLIRFQDPFWIGLSSSISVSDQQGSGARTMRGLQGQLSYGWDFGTAITLSAPLIVSDSNPALGVKSPRIGGGNDGRIQATALFRLWGDAKDYLGILAGVGLPYQSDPQMRLTGQASWSLPTMLLWRLDGEALAWRGSFQQDLRYSTAVETSPGVKTYYDAGNVQTLSNTFAFFSHTRFSPTLSWVEVFPSAEDIGIDGINSNGISGVDMSSASFLVSRVHTGRNRALGVGFDSVPFRRRFVFSATGFYNWIKSAPDQSDWQWTGRFQWVF